MSVFDEPPIIVPMRYATSNRAPRTGIATIQTALRCRPWPWLCGTDLALPLEQPGDGARPNEERTMDDKDLIQSMAQDDLLEHGRDHLDGCGCPECEEQDEREEEDPKDYDGPAWGQS